MAAELTYSQRRVLGNLPAYRTQAEFDQIDADREAAGLVEQDGSVIPYPRSRTIPVLAGILERDPHTPLGEADVEQLTAMLESLEAAGLTKRSGDEWAMTRKGLDALTAPLEAEPPPLEGPALLAALGGNVEMARAALEAEKADPSRTPEQVAAAQEVFDRQSAALAAAGDGS